MSTNCYPQWFEFNSGRWTDNSDLGDSFYRPISNRSTGPSLIVYGRFVADRKYNHPTRNEKKYICSSRLSNSVVFRYRPRLLPTTSSHIVTKRRRAAEDQTFRGVDICPGATAITDSETINIYYTLFRSDFIFLFLFRNDNNNYCSTTYLLRRARLFLRGSFLTFFRPKSRR